MLIGVYSGFQSQSTMHYILIYVTKYFELQSRILYYTFTRNI
jgi:hypothetical protein